MKNKRDYFDEIRMALIHRNKDLFWICDRIAWAYKWRKINKAQMEYLAEWTTELLNADTEARR